MVLTELNDHVIDALHDTTLSIRFSEYLLNNSIEDGSIHYMDGSKKYKVTNAGIF